LQQLKKKDLLARKHDPVFLIMHSILLKRSEIAATQIDNVYLRKAFVKFEDCSKHISFAPRVLKVFAKQCQLWIKDKLFKNLTH
jgi:hypothetical protein